jgi:hypothetical protein
MVDRVDARGFPSALLAALCAHAAAALAVSFTRTSPATESIAQAPPESLFDVSEEPPPAPPSQAEEAAGPGVSPRGSRFTGPSRKQTAPAAGVAELDELPAAPADPAPAAPGAGPVDLGVGTYWKSVALGDAAQAPRAEAPAAPSLDQMLRDAMEEHDRAVGLGPEGPLVSAAHEAASPAIAPDVGTATFEVECDEHGGGVTARVVSIGADLAAWNDVARELVRICPRRGCTFRRALTTSARRFASPRSGRCRAARI